MVNRSVRDEGTGSNDKEQDGMRANRYNEPDEFIPSYRKGNNARV